MATVLGTLAVKLGVDNAELLKGLKHADTAIGGFSTAVGAAAKVATVGLAALAGGLALALRGAAQQQEAEAQLANAFAATGQSLDIASFREYASALQGVTTFGDEAIMSAGGLLARFGATEQQIRKVLPAITDMSAALGQDLGASARVIGMALAGNIGMLSRYGIVLSEAEKKEIASADSAGRLAIVQGLLEARFKGAAEAAANTLGGAFTQLKNQTGDAVQALGVAIESGGVFTSIAKVATKVMGELTTWISTNNETLRAWTMTGWSMVVSAIGIFIDALEFAGKGLMLFKVAGNAVIVGLITLFDGLLFSVQTTVGAFATIENALDIRGPLTVATQAIANFRAGVGDVRDTFVSTAADGVAGWDTIGRAADAARTKMASIDVQVRETAATISTALPAAAAKAAAGINESLSTVLDFSQEIIDETFDLGKIVGEELIKEQEKLRQQFENTANVVSGAMLSIMEDMLDTETTAVEVFKNALKLILDLVKKAILAYAIEAAAAQYAQGAALGPVTGLLAGAALAALALSAVQAMVGKLPSAAVGGFVQESGLAVVHRNETIVPAQIAQPFQGMGGGGIVIERLEATNPTTINQAQIDNFLIEVDRRRRVLRRRGLVDQ